MDKKEKYIAANESSAPPLNETMPNQQHENPTYNKNDDAPPPYPNLPDGYQSIGICDLPQGYFNTPT
jgi:hypothetical protein